jgi:NAD(P)H dehydrogenase (quinone)
MRVLILYANPIETSFGAALHRQVVEALRPRTHVVDDCDLYFERFDPILSKQDRAEYHDMAKNRLRMAPYADRLLVPSARNAELTLIARVDSR